MHKSIVFAEHEYRKARKSGGLGGESNCVQVARGAGWVEIRDTKKQFGATDDYRLVFTDAQFDAYLAGVRSDDVTGLALNVTLRSDGMYIFRNLDPQTDISADVELEYTADEIDAFHDGVCKFEFDLLVAA